MNCVTASHPKAMTVITGKDTSPLARNLRAALVLLSVAAMFFLGVIAKHWLLD